MTTQPPPESAEPAPVATDTQARSVSTARPLTAADLMPATPVPAGDAEVSHERARGAVEFNGTITESLATLRRYIDQCEARQQQAEREVAELTELMAKEHAAAVKAYAERDELSRQLEAAEREVAELHRLERSARRVLETMTHERDALKARVAELEVQLKSGNE